MKELLTCYEDLAATRPRDPAVIYQREPYIGITLTWSDLCARAAEIREELLRSGAQGDCIPALVLDDNPDLIPTLLALWQLDSSPVLLDPKWGTRLTNAILAHSKPKFIVETEFSIRTTLLNPDSPSDVPADTAFIGYTSGSTGDPKAIVFTHERLHAGTPGNASASLRLRGVRPTRLARSTRMSGCRRYQLAPHLGVCPRLLHCSTSGTERVVRARILVSGGVQQYRSDISESARLLGKGRR